MGLNVMMGRCYYDREPLRPDSQIRVGMHVPEMPLVYHLRQGESAADILHDREVTHQLHSGRARMYMPRVSRGVGVGKGGAVLLHVRSLSWRSSLHPCREMDEIRTLGPDDLAFPQQYGLRCPPQGSSHCIIG